MGRKKNPAAVALGKLAAAKRTREQLAEAGRRGGLSKAANRQRFAEIAEAVHDHFEELGTPAENIQPTKKKAKK
jgi:hypothetical protein